MKFAPRESWRARSTRSKSGSPAKTPVVDPDDADDPDDANDANDANDAGNADDAVDEQTNFCLGLPRKIVRTRTYEHLSTRQLWISGKLTSGLAVDQLWRKREKKLCTKKP